MHERHAARFACEFERPVERGIAAAEDHEPLAGEIRGALHLVVNVPALERFAALHAQLARLKRSQAARDDDGARMKARVARRAQQERVVLEHFQLRDFLAQMKLRVERLRLLHQPIDQLLRAAHRQRGDVVDRLFRIELAALPARMLQRIDDVRADAEQSELEDLKQTAGSRADDDDVGLNCAVNDRAAGALAQERLLLKIMPPRVRRAGDSIRERSHG